MTSIKKEIKLNIFKSIASSGFFDMLIANEQIMSFLESIWELRVLPSTDNRFKDLGGDIRQHIINNDDWDIDILFLEKLSLLDADVDIFQKFLEKVVDAKFHKEESEIRALVDTINEYLNKERFELAIFSYSDDGIPEYLVTQAAGTSISTDFPLNTIPFFVDKNPSGYSHKISSHNKPEQYPAFILVADGWDDFGVESAFDLFYYKEVQHPPVHIGSIKIINKIELTRVEVEEKRYRKFN